MTITAGVMTCFVYRGLIHQKYMWRSLHDGGGLCKFRLIIDNYDLRTCGILIIIILKENN